MVAKKTVKKSPRKKVTPRKNTSVNSATVIMTKGDERLFGTKELIQGLLIGLVVGFVIGVLIFKGGL